ncbi:serine/threonine-protein kinase SSN3 [Acrasis kona]|uniref:Serine/threonine-protein kinase SSN3 n=1 Tax=Acrasis kona TaxID=1008807 RepID=A0AAW2ZAM3_9EUKA
MSSRYSHLQVLDEQDSYTPFPVVNEEKKVFEQEVARTEDKTLTHAKKRLAHHPEPNQLDLNSMSRAARNAPGSSVAENWLERTMRDGWEVVTGN